MHPQNIHAHRYDLESLSQVHPPLSEFILNTGETEHSIDFSSRDAVLALNVALLKKHYNVEEFNLPENALIPPIPSRADYLFHLRDHLPEKTLQGMDVGCGASAVYCILATTILDCHMVGTDISEQSVQYAMDNTAAYDAIEIRHQQDRGSILRHVIKEGEHFDFTVCNPPFYTSQQEADKASRKKSLNLGTGTSRNFAGADHELWCNGGEALFVKRMIKESASYGKQVGVFTSLISRKENLTKLVKLTKRVGAVEKVVEMQSGNKISHLLMWKFAGGF